MSKYTREVPIDKTRKWKHFYRYFDNGEASILDVGCSHGNFAQHEPGRVLGIDRELQALAIAADRSQAVVCGDLDQRLPFRSETFDAVNCDSVIEHVSNPSRLMREIFRLLKPRGRVVVVTPDLKRVKLDFWRDYTHRNPFIKESLEQLLVDVGLHVVELGYQSFHYLKFFDSWNPTSRRRRLLGFFEDKIGMMISANLLAVGERPATEGQDVNH